MVAIIYHYCNSFELFHSDDCSVNTCKVKFECDDYYLTQTTLFRGNLAQNYLKSIDHQNGP